MTKAVTLSLQTGSLADPLEELAGRFGEALAGKLAPDRLTGLRETIRILQAEAANRAKVGCSSALGRVGMLTEVWECLATDPGSQADEVGFFCAKALSQLARSERQGDGGNDGIVDWVLEHSSSTWGEYVNLLESEEKNDPDGDDAIDDSVCGLEEFDPCNGAEPEGSLQIDAQALIRLFQGASSRDQADSTDSKPPSVEVPRRPPSQAPPVPIPPVVAMPAKRAVAVQPVKILPAFAIPPLPRKIVLDEEIREAFLADASDLFERIEPLVLGLGSGTDPGQSLRELGRCFHTLKGAAGSVGLADLASLVHALEEHLEMATAPASTEVIDVLHQTVGYLDGLIGLLRNRPANAGSHDQAYTVDRDGGGDDSVSPSTKNDLPVAAPVIAAVVSNQDPCSAQETSSEAAGDGPIRVPASRFDELMDLVSELISRRQLWSAQAGSLKSLSIAVRNCRGRMLTCLDRLHEAGLARENRSTLLEGGLDLPGQLRRLSELADDLAVLAETAQAVALPLADHGDVLGRVTLQLWDELQRIRIVSIRGLFQRLARVAHDAARVEGRQVEVVMVGEETGLDRAVQDKAFEPLLHVVRNAVGHGIESSADRQASGKPATGRITLEAHREGNTLVIAIQDDGRGLDHEAIAAKARRSGLLAADENPTIERLNSLIFHSGFSTKAEANAISGRGVGMDVVAREVGLLEGHDRASDPARPRNPADYPSARSVVARDRHDRSR